MATFPNSKFWHQGDKAFTWLRKTNTPVVMGAGNSSNYAPLGTASANALEFYFTSAHATGDTRGEYLKLRFTSTGSGEALRAYGEVGAAAVATGGTVNGAHITLGVLAAGTVSGAGNAARFTLGFADTAVPAGTLSAIQIDSDFHNGSTVAAGLCAIRLTNSNTKTWPNLLEIPAASNGTIFAAHITQTMTHSIRIRDAAGTAYYVMVTNAATNRS